ncbi:glycosyltransferase [Dongia deserti]|uniref:glycosyltransferase n=1 Tax=Dongia deserti TaxID=2268030 RepID=UPI0013C51CB8|nr:glycosyltransferase [Dongia deserti]
MSHRGGGVFDAVRRVASALQSPPEFQIAVFGLAEERPAVQPTDWDGVHVCALPVLGPQSIGFAPRLAGVLAKAKVDLLHVHGLWMYPSVASLLWSHGTGRPYMISAHGMLDGWALGNSRWKKCLALSAYERRHLDGAACLHALCEAEAESFRSLGLRNPICIIPNYVDRPDLVAIPGGDRMEEPSRTLLYLGRLHPKKGLVNLLLAWCLFDGRRGLGEGNWQLVLAGWDQGGHERDLYSLAAQLGVTDSVRFAGPQFGAAKDAIYRKAAGFVLPSVSEGLPLVVLEAWSYGLPVLMTEQCNIPEGFVAGAALPIAPDGDGILQGLRTFAAMTDPERQQMGMRGLQLVQHRFSQSVNSEALKDVYRWLNRAGPRPASVVSG